MRYSTSAKWNIAYSRSSATVRRCRGCSSVCQPVVISVRSRAQTWRCSCGIEVRIEPIEQRRGHALLAPQLRAARGFGGMRDEDGLDAQAGRAARSTSSSDRPCALICASASSMPPGCGRPPSARKYSRRRRMRCTFSARLTAWNQVENARTRSRAMAGGRPATRCVEAPRPLPSPSRRPMAARRSPSTSVVQRRHRPARAASRPPARRAGARPRAAPGAWAGTGSDVGPRRRDSTHPRRLPCGRQRARGPNHPVSRMASACSMDCRHAIHHQHIAPRSTGPPAGSRPVMPCRRSAVNATSAPRARTSASVPPHRPGARRDHDGADASPGFFGSRPPPTASAGTTPRSVA